MNQYVSDSIIYPLVLKKSNYKLTKYIYTRNRFISGLFASLGKLGWYWVNSDATKPRSHLEMNAVNPILAQILNLGWVRLV